MAIVTTDIFCRIEEMKESVKIIKQCLSKMEKGPIKSLMAKFHHLKEMI